MIIDGQLLFSNAQALTATAVSTNVIDMGSDGNLGIGEPMVVRLNLDVAADDGDADETYVVALQTDDNVGFASATEIGSATITRGDAAGSVYLIHVPATTSGEQFFRLNYTLGGTTPSATVTAFLTASNMIQNDVVYADNITIS